MIIKLLASDFRNVPSMGRFPVGVLGGEIWLGGEGVLGGTACVIWWTPYGQVWSGRLNSAVQVAELLRDSSDWMRELALARYRLISLGYGNNDRILAYAEATSGLRERLPCPVPSMKVA